MLTASRLITLCVTMVSSMLLSRFRTLEEYGTYSQLLMIVTLAVSLFSMGLPNSTVFFLSRAADKKEKCTFITTYYTLVTVISIVLALVLPLSLPGAARYFGNESICNYTLFVIIYPWTQMIINGVSNFFVIYDKIKPMFFINLLHACSSLFSIFAVQLLSYGFQEYICFFLVCESLVAFLVYIYSFHLERPFLFRLDLRLIKGIFTYSIPIGLATLVSTINIEIDKLMVGRHFDTETLAIYTNASKELPFYIFASSLTAIILPNIAKRLKNNDVDGSLHLWKNAILLSFYVICFCAMNCIVFSEQIITILYSEKYAAGAVVFMVYSCALLMKTTYFGMILNATGKTNFVLYSSVASLAINILLNTLLMNLLGIVGPAIATVVSMMICGLAQLLYSCRILKVRFRSLFPWLGLLKILVLNLGLGICLSIVSAVWNLGTDLRGILSAIAIGCVILLVYFMVTKNRILQLWKNLG